MLMRLREEPAEGMLLKNLSLALKEKGKSDPDPMRAFRVSAEIGLILKML